MNVKSRARIGFITATAALSLAALAVPASANPPAGEYRQLAGVGSDTTQDVVNGLGDVVTNASGKIIASYDATGTSPLKTRAVGCDTLARPDGSGAGIAALNNAVDNSTGCLDFARSSSGPSDTSTTDLTFIPFAKDGVTYATRSFSALPTNLTKTQLTDIYKCTLTSLNGVTIQPLLPQTGSGTRKFWLNTLGLTDATIGSCVNGTIQENNGLALTNNSQIMPYSIAQYIAQGKSLPNVPNRRGSAVLRNVNGVAPTTSGVLNTAFPIVRDVYNVVPTAKLTDALISSTFVGSTSKVCAQTTVIQNYGFGSLGTACGATTVKGEK
ncbi:substrate-binding domain-containing protein [Streptomyces sp. NPDC006733]|uniref:substrate-binding domain-containing protein n=1 Tax=Streptomyces sp. NPDC006733 TaxID=3155460 RepID=UPI0033C6CDC9